MALQKSEEMSKLTRTLGNRHKSYREDHFQHYSFTMDPVQNHCGLWQLFEGSGWLSLQLFLEAQGVSDFESNLTTNSTHLRLFERLLRSYI
jgi:hypothetical protein